MADFGGDPEAFRAEARTWLEANFPKSLKGKGVSYMENKPIWAYRSPNKEEFALAMKELAGGAT